MKEKYYLNKHNNMTSVPVTWVPTFRKSLPNSDAKKSLNSLLDSSFPDNTRKWNRTMCPPCKGVYTWSSTPKAFINNRQLLRTQLPKPAKSTEPFRNVMHDKRVVRGSNYSQAQLMLGDAENSIKEAEARRRKFVRKTQNSFTKNRRDVIGTPPPVYGRIHENVQTEKYLEEVFEKPQEIDASAQTDLFLHRPPSPPYTRSKTGIDVATEILQGELFIFDIEVQPIIDTLVSYSVEQGLIEVIHEEEIAEIRKQQQEFLTIRAADLAELRRLESEEIRLHTEKERRLRQEAFTKNLDVEMEERITAAKFLQGHVGDLMPEVLQQMESLTDIKNREELEYKLCPWLSKEVTEEVEHMIDSREILTEIIKEVLRARSEQYAKLAEFKKLEELNKLEEYKKQTSPPEESD